KTSSEVFLFWYIKSMHKLTLSVRQTYYDAIARGAKTIEGRLAKAKYLELKPGDTVTFSNDDNTTSLTKTVKAVHSYPTFDDAFKEQNFKRAIPDANTVEDAIRVYESFYPQLVQREHGVVFIELE